MEQIRNLSSIEKILSITPIDGADKIECVMIKGWSLVAKKGEFKVGDLCVYFEMDTLMPKLPCFEFLETRKYRIKAVKLRGCYSYGIAFPLSILDECMVDGWSYDVNRNVITSNFKTETVKEGLLLDEMIDVKKYDNEEGESKSEILFKANPKKNWLVNKINFYKFRINKYFSKFNKKKVSGKFPTWLVPKTDQSRYQSLKNDERLSLIGKTFQKEEKLDGSSLTVLLNKKDFMVCSRNLRLSEQKDNNYWKVVYKYDLKNKLKKLKRNIALQMEMIGEGIQGNRYNISGVDMRVFDIYDIDNHKYLTPDEFLNICLLLELPTVPIIDENYILGDNGEELIASSIKNSVLYTKCKQEGYVFKLKEGNRRYSFKVINPEYLLEKN